MQKIRDMKIANKVIIPMVVLFIAVVMNGVGSIINLKVVMNLGTEVNQVHVANVYNIELLNGDLERLQKLVYTHCITADNAQMREIETAIDQAYTEIDALVTTISENLPEGEMTEMFAEYPDKFQNFITVFTEAIVASAGGNKDEAATIINMKVTKAANELSEYLNKLILLSQQEMITKVSNQRITYTIAMVEGIVVTAIATIVWVVVLFIIFRFIIAPLKLSNQKVREIVSGIEEGKGDLTGRIPLNGKDEIGQLADGINIFLETLQQIMLSITTNSQKLDEIVSSVSTSVQTANHSSMDISAVMEELSASMEEVASSVSDINENAGEVMGEVTELATASDELVQYAKEMRTRASELEATAVENKTNASEMIHSIFATLKQAIEDSKSVERVNDLTGQILNISSQTNLLALNASIEAARAGDAGRGFAVVADEIRQLADSSKETANNIQAVNAMVTSAVKELVKSSNELVTYINERVLLDYESLVASGKQYNEDAEHVHEVVDRFNVMSASLNDLIEGITQAITGISSIVDESANGVATAATNTGELVKEMGYISEDMESNNKIAGELKKYAEIFEKL